MLLVTINNNWYFQLYDYSSELESRSLNQPQSKVFQLKNQNRDPKVTKRSCPESLVKGLKHDREAERQRRVGV